MISLFPGFNSNESVSNVKVIPSFDSFIFKTSVNFFSSFLGSISKFPRYFIFPFSNKTHHLQKQGVTFSSYFYRIPLIRKCCNSIMVLASLISPVSTIESACSKGSSKTSMFSPSSSSPPPSAIFISAEYSAVKK